LTGREHGGIGAGCGELRAWEGRWEDNNKGVLGHAAATETLDCAVRLLSISTHGYGTSSVGGDGGGTIVAACAQCSASGQAELQGQLLGSPPWHGISLLDLFRISYVNCQAACQPSKLEPSRLRANVK
jgi:hypothetical protein